MLSIFNIKNHLLRICSWYKDKGVHPILLQYIDLPSLEQLQSLHPNIRKGFGTHLISSE